MVKCKELSKTTKMGVYNAIVKPTLLYGSKKWIEWAHVYILLPHILPWPSEMPSLSYYVMHHTTYILHTNRHI